MSSKTKIVVLKARELIYTGIFILLGILLILLLIFMFVPSHKSKKTKETSGYTQGVYSSPLKLGENELELSVTVKDGKARSVSLKHLNKSIKTMYPLIEPSLNEINKQLPKVQNIDDIKFDGQSQYTYTLLKQADFSIYKAPQPLQMHWRSSSLQKNLLHPNAIPIQISDSMQH